MKLQKLFLMGLGTILILGGVGYWYTFVEGAPQFDPPPISEAGTGMTFQLENFPSQAMGQTRQYGLVLPPDYQKNPTRRYPVIFLLHGGHDDARAWIDKYGLIPVLHQLYQSGKLPPSIVITPDGNDRRGSSPLWDPDYYDGPNGKIGTLIGSELVQVVKSRYRTLDKPEFWAMGGDSSGGWGALNIGLRHLNHFCVLFSHSGYFTDDSGAANSPQSFISQIPLAKTTCLRVYLDAGQADVNFLASTQQFHQKLSQLKIPNEFHAFPGGHGLSGADYGWNYFHKHSVDSLSYVGQQFKDVYSERTRTAFGAYPKK